nr:putative P7 protein [Cytorhabdovirus sp.]
MDYYLNRDWTKDIKQQALFPGLSIEWKIILVILSGVIIFCTLLSIIKLGYSLTMAFIKFSFLCLIFLLELCLISSLLYPIKGLHWILMKLIEFFGTRIIKFLEIRLENSAIKRFFREDVLERSIGISSSERFSQETKGSSDSSSHEIKQI